MSVIMTLRVPGDPARLEEHAAANADRLSHIVETARRHGLIAHRFYGSENEIMVVDEWPDPQSFQAFFDEAQGEIGPVMAAAGVSSEPTVTFWRKLDTRDDVGWDAA